MATKTELEIHCDNGIYYFSKNGESIGAADLTEVQFDEDVVLNKEQLLAIAERLQSTAKES